MSLENDIERIIEVIEKQERDVTMNMVRQLRAIKDRLRSNRYYMAESGRAVLGDQYPPPAHDFDGNGFRRN